MKLSLPRTCQDYHLIVFVPLSLAIVSALFHVVQPLVLSVSPQQLYFSDWRTVERLIKLTDLDCSLSSLIKSLQHPIFSLSKIYTNHVCSHMNISYVLQRLIPAIDSQYPHSPRIRSLLFGFECIKNLSITDIYPLESYRTSFAHISKLPFSPTITHINFKVPCIARWLQATRWDNQGLEMVTSTPEEVIQIKYMFPSLLNNDCVPRGWELVDSRYLAYFTNKFYEQFLTNFLSSQDGSSEFTCRYIHVFCIAYDRNDETVMNKIFGILQPFFSTIADPLYLYKDLAETNIISANRFLFELAVISKLASKFGIFKTKLCSLVISQIYQVLANDTTDNENIPMPEFARLFNLAIQHKMINWIDILYRFLESNFNYACSILTERFAPFLTRSTILKFPLAARHAIVRSHLCKDPSHPCLPLVPFPFDNHLAEGLAVIVRNMVDPDPKMFADMLVWMVNILPKENTWLAVVELDLTQRYVVTLMETIISNFFVITGKTGQLSTYRPHSLCNYEILVVFSRLLYLVAYLSIKLQFQLDCDFVQFAMQSFLQDSPRLNTKVDQWISQDMYSISLSVGSKALDEEYQIWQDPYKEPHVVRDLLVRNFELLKKSRLHCPLSHSLSPFEVDPKHRAMITNKWINFGIFFTDNSRITNFLTVNEISAIFFNSICNSDVP